MGASPMLLDDLPLPRRVAIVQALAEILRTEHALADHYAAFAARSGPAPLKAGLAELARAKAARVVGVEALFRAVVGDSEPEAVSSGPLGLEPSVGSREEAFATAFRGERALEVSYRELAALVTDPGLYPGLLALAAEAAGHRARLRDLYLRYS